MDREKIMKVDAIIITNGYLATSDASTPPEPEKLRKNTIGKVSDIKLDEDLQKKSENVERDSDPDDAGVGGRVDTPARTKRREQTALPDGIVFTFKRSICCFNQPAGGPLRLNIAAHRRKSHNHPVIFQAVLNNHSNTLHSISLPYACAAVFLHYKFHIKPFIIFNN